MYIQCGFLVVLGLGPRALCLLGKNPTTRLHLRPNQCDAEIHTGFLAPPQLSGMLGRRSAGRVVCSLAGRRTQLLSPELSTAHSSTHVNTAKSNVEGDFTRDIKPTEAVESRAVLSNSNYHDH